VFGLAGVERIPLSLRLQTQLYSNLLHSPVVVSLQTAPSVPNIVERRNKRAGMSAYGQVGSATGGQ